MAVTDADLRHIAALARLGLPAERTAALVHELNGILAHMDVLQRVDVSAGDPTLRAAAPTPLRAAAPTPLRADIENAVPLERPREAFAPAMRDGFFLVPRFDTHGGTDAATGSEQDAHE